MKKKILYIHNEIANDKIFIAIKSDLYAQLIAHVSFMRKDFIIEDLLKKIDLFEVLVFLLIRDLNVRVKPEIPKNLYLQKEQMYCEITLYKVKYKLLQGHEKDGKILMLLALKDFVRRSIETSGKIIGEFISKKAEAYQNKNTN